MNRQRHPCLLGLLGLFSLLAYGTITWLSGSFIYGQGHLHRPIIPFLLVYAGAFVCYLLAIRTLTFGRPFQEAENNRNRVWIILGFAVLFRGVMLFSNPIQEDDFYRYLWDGKVVASGLNPYRFAPRTVHEKKVLNEELASYTQLAEEDPHIAFILSRVNHANIPTIYPPFTQAVFGLAASVAPGSLQALRIVFLGFDLAICGLVIVLLRHLSLNPAFVLIYAWSPLVIKETANSTHYDVVPTLCLVLGLLLMLKGRALLAQISLAAAVLGKLYPILLMPLFFVRVWKKHGARPALGGLGAGAGVMLLGYAPFWEADLLWTGTRTFAEQWQTNSFIFPWIVSLVDERWIANVIVGGLLGGAILAVVRWGELSDDIQFVWANSIVLGLLFVLSPVGNPWYFLWLVPVLCIFPLRSWLLLSGLLGLYYLSFYFIYRGKVETFEWVVWLEYLPFYGMLLWEWWHGVYKWKGHTSESMHEVISG
jgi:hypothetical protein